MSNQLVRRLLSITLSIALAAVGLIGVTTVTAPAAHAAVTNIGIGFDGPVNDIEQSCDITYVGGEFTSYGLQTGGSARVHINNAELDRTFSSIQGHVYAAVSDGDGGYYIGGDFTSVNGQKRWGFAYLKNDGSVDETMVVDVNDGSGTPQPRTVYAVTVDPLGNVYLGGDFEGYEEPGGVGTAHRALALMAGGGVDTTFNPDPTLDSTEPATIYSMTYYDTWILIGGDFDEIAGNDAKGLASYAAMNNDGIGMINPLWHTQVDGVVKSMAFSTTDPSSLYIGGSFSSVSLTGTGPTARNNAALISVAAETMSAWDPNVNGTTPEVAALAASDDAVWLGGSFSTVSGTNRANLAAVDSTTGAPINDFSADTDGAVTGLTFFEETLYVGGNFATIGGATQPYAARVDAGTGALDTNFAPVLNGAMTVAIVEDLSVYLGGLFTTFDGQTRIGLAALDSSLALTSWAPQTWHSIPESPGAVTDMTISQGVDCDLDKVYFIGDFDQVRDGTATGTRKKMAAVNASGDLDTNWLPAVSGGLDEPTAITNAGGLIYVGGNFGRAGTTGNPTASIRNNFAAWDGLGVLQAWAIANGPMNPQAMAADINLVYAGGSWSSFSGKAGIFAATAGPSGGTVSSTFTTTVDSTGRAVGAMQLHGSNLYFGGTFSSVNATSVNNLVAVDRTTGVLTGFAPNVVPTSGLETGTAAVQALGVNDDQVYIGGYIDEVGGTSVPRLAALDIASGALDTSFDAGVPDGGIPSTISAGNSKIYFGGNFLGSTGQIEDTRGAFFNYGTNSQSSAPTVTGVLPNSGPLGEKSGIVISGTGFLDVSGADAVKFGSQNASSYTVNSDMQIIATAPASQSASTNTVNISVTSPGGTSADTASDDYTYYAAPTVTSVAPNNGSLGSKSGIVITGTNFVGVSGAAAVKFGSQNASSYVVNSNTQITATAPASQSSTTETVSVVVTATGGTSADTASDNYTYYAAPAITGVNPSSGPLTQQSGIVITGTNFVGVSGAAAVKFGAQNAVSYVVDSATQITAVAPATQSSTTETVSISVTGTGGTSADTADDNYTYTASTPAPTISGVSPNAGPLGQKAGIVITGTGFVGVSGASAVKFGSQNAVSYVVDSATQITAVAPATQSSTTETVNISVTGTGGTSADTANDNYTYNAAPTITNVSPNTGPLGQKTGIVITGTGFVGVTGASAVKFGNQNAVSYVVDSATQITVVAPATQSSTTETVNISVTGTGGTSADTANDNYTYNAAPTITNVSPNTGPLGQKTDIVITGTNFVGVSGASAVKFGSQNAVSYVVDSATQITAVAPATQSSTTETVNISVTGTGGTSTDTADDNYTYFAGPTITSVSPNIGSLDQQAGIVITGTGFTGVSGASAVKFGAHNAVSYVVDSATQITAVAPASPDGTTNTVDISVTGTGGTSPDTADDDYTYYAAPTIAGVAPNSGPLTGTSGVVITGTDFINVSSVTVGGTAAQIVSVDSDTQLTINVPATAATATTTEAISVVALGGTGTLTNAFTYNAPDPAKKSVDVKFVDLPLQFTSGIPTTFHIEVGEVDLGSFSSSATASINGEAKITANDQLICVAQVVNGKGKCTGTIPVSGKFVLKAVFAGTVGGSSGTATATSTVSVTTSASTLAITRASLKLPKGQCYAKLAVAGQTAVKSRTITLWMKSGKRWVKLGKTKPTKTLKWKLTASVLDRKVTIRAKQGKTTTAAVKVKLTKTNHSRGC